MCQHVSSNLGSRSAGCGGEWKTSSGCLALACQYPQRTGRNILVFILFVIIHLHFALSTEPPLLLDPSAKLGSVLVQYADQAELEWIFTWP